MSGKKLRLLLWGLVAVNLAALAWVGIIKPRMDASVLDTLGQGEYSLTTTTGDTFTEDTLAQGPSMVFFGFTHCPDVCPTTLGDILTWQEELPESKDMNVFFVTVDPDRDTSDILGDYVGWVDGVQGVTGSQEEVDKALEAFRIYAARVPLEGGDYTMDHSASVLLFDERGRYTDRIRYQEELPSAVEKLRGVLGS
ncbi:MAG: SCO family protein [Pseudomonadota bacterium]